MQANFGTDPFTGEPVSVLELTDFTDTEGEFLTETARDNRFIFIQDTWTVHPQWELTLGLRYDRYSDFGSTTNPRLGLVWEPRSDLVAKLLYGRAFRAPSFAEMDIRNNPSVSAGKVALKPEEIETWELAFDYRLTDKMNLALNFFRYNVTERIGDVLGDDDVDLVHANVGKWEGTGGEFELRWKTSNKSSLLFNYSYQNSEDELTGDTLPNAPKQTAYLRMDYLLGSKWYVDGQVHWIGRWPREPNDFRPDMDGYSTVDLIVRRKDIRAGNTNFAIGVKNIFDEEVYYPSPGPDIDGSYKLPNDLPGPGRFYFIELRYKF